MRVKPTPTWNCLKKGWEEVWSRHESHSRRRRGWRRWISRSRTKYVEAKNKEAALIGAPTDLKSVVITQKSWKNKGCSPALRHVRKLLLVAYSNCELTDPKPNGAQNPSLHRSALAASNSPVSLRPIASSQSKLAGQLPTLVIAWEVSFRP